MSQTNKGHGGTPNLGTADPLPSYSPRSGIEISN